MVKAQSQTFVLPVRRIHTCQQAICCSMAVSSMDVSSMAVSSDDSYGFKDQFTLISLAPDPLPGASRGHPTVKCQLCGLVFVGNVTRQRAHLRRLTRSGVRICPAVASKAPELDAELQQEVQQEKLDQAAKKRAAPSSSSSSKLSKQQKLAAGFARMDQSQVHKQVAAFFYAEGIPFWKVGGTSNTYLG